MKAHIQRLYVSIVVSMAILTFYPDWLVAENQQSGVIGYIDESRFHPLVVVTPQTITKADSTKMDLRGELRNAFQANSASFSIQKQSDYVDPHGEDKPGRYAAINKKFSSIRDFFTLQHSPFPSQSPDLNKELVRSFYTFFSRDNWGSAFFQDKKVLKQPIEEIAKKTNLRIHAVTDLNNNSRQELWITYKLMHGEVGRIVYEQASEGSDWEELATHCYMCD